MFIYYIPEGGYKPMEENIEENHDEILTVNETATLLKICRVNAYALFNKRGFPCFRIGKSLRIYKKDLLNYFKNNPNN